jgi:hypothetical protein
MRHLFPALALAVLTGCLAPSDFRAYERGRKEAERDWQRGTPAYRVVGLPSTSSERFYAVLRQQYGVGVQSHGCWLKENEAPWMKGYNDRLARYLETRYGSNVIAAALEEAQ